MSNVAERTHEQKTGMKCPQYGTFIETSIFGLLASNVLQYLSRHLRLDMDRMKSKPTSDVL